MKSVSQIEILLNRPLHALLSRMHSLTLDYGILNFDGVPRGQDFQPNAPTMVEVSSLVQVLFNRLYFCTLHLMMIASQKKFQSLATTTASDNTNWPCIIDPQCSCICNYHDQLSTAAQSSHLLSSSYQDIKSQTTTDKLVYNTYGQSLIQGHSTAWPAHDTNEEDVAHIMQ